MSDHSKDEHFTKGFNTVQFVQTTLNQYPEIKSVCLTLKRLLSINDLNEPYTGGLSSIALFVIVLHCFNMFGRMSEEQLFEQVLYYIGCFDHQKLMITYFGTLERTSNDGSVFHIEHPLDSKINVSKGSFRMQEIQDLFLRTHDNLTKGKSLNLT